MQPEITSVDFHFDVMCPYAYQTSKWIRHVRSQNGIEINWRFFSLEEVNRRGQEASVGTRMELWLVDASDRCVTASHLNG